MKSPAFQTALTPAFVAEALGLNIPAILSGSDPQRFAGVTTDSRKVVPGTLFVALKGEKFDGHDFIQEVVAAGARGVICRKGQVVPKDRGTHVFPVDDTLVAYRKLAGAWRKEFPIPVIAVAGSVGKTTSKELLAAVLEGKWPHVLRTSGSQNGFVGIPMTLLELRPPHQAAVIEVGIDELGAMAQHLPLVNPTASILTAIGAEHLEKLKDIPTVAREEGLALSFVTQIGGFVAINLDDPWIRPHFTTLRHGKKLGYSFRPEVVPSAEHLVACAVGEGLIEEIEVSGADWENERFRLVLPGEHNMLNQLGAMAIARGLGLTADEVRAGLAKFKGAAGRSELRELPGPTPVICDYYNANPSSTDAGLKLLEHVSRGPSADPRKRVRWACLGDMLELGPDEEKFHRDLASRILELKVEHVLLCGPRMAWLADELVQRSYAGELNHYVSPAELGDYLKSHAVPGDAILIKGSRGMKMEGVWEKLEKQGGLSGSRLV